MKRSCLVLSPTLFGRDFLPHGARALPGVGVGAKWGVTAGDQRPPTRRVPSQLVPPSAGPLSCPRPSYATSEESRILVLTELLERKAHSPFYQEGVSNALLKMAELGLTRAAAVLLRNGANLNFEGPPEPGGLGWTDGVGVAWAGGRVVKPPGSALICLRGDARGSPHWVASQPAGFPEALNRLCSEQVCHCSCQAIDLANFPPAPS